MKLKVLLVGIALAMASGAQGAIRAGSTTSPELFLAVWDSSGTTSTTVLVDLGISAATFDFNQDISRTVDLSGLGSIATRSFALVTGGTDAATFAGLFYTAGASFAGNIFQGATAINEVLNNITNIGSLVATPDHFGTGDFAANNATTSTAPGGVIPGGLNYAGLLQDLTTSNLVNGASVGQALAFFTSVFNTSSGLVETSRLGSTRLWNLVGNSLTFASETAPPIPLPAGVWLLGSALLGLVGVARRRAPAQQ